MSVTALEQITDTPLPEPAERSPDDLRQEIKEKKEAIAETLSRVDERIQRAVDWRAQVGDHPFLALGVALSLGCIVSGVFKSRPSPQERIMEALADGVDNIAEQVRDRIDAQFGWPRRGGALKATAAALATRTAMSYLSNQLGRVSKAPDARLNRSGNNIK
jgi:ElaB/YqjD/DUF883 family membrane-anchored ribosome-binding protein